MPATFDHVTICVTDVDEALRFFGVLGFEVVKRVVATGPTMDAYMGLDAMRADHVTLAIPGAEPYQEVQLLCFYSPPVEVDAGSGFLARTDWRCTAKPGKLFFILFKWPRDAFALPHFKNPGKQAYLLADPERQPLNLRTAKNNTVLVALPRTQPNPVANVICV